MSQKRFKTPTVGVVYDGDKVVDFHVNGDTFNSVRYTTTPGGGIELSAGGIPISMGRQTPVVVASFGDSYASGNVDALVAPYRVRPAEGGAVWANSFCGSPIEFVGRGVGGETSSQILARLDTVAENFVVVYAGTNDINNASPVTPTLSVLSTLKANLTAIMDAFDASNRRYAIATIAPKGTTGGLSVAGWSGNQLQMQAEANRWIRQQAKARGQRVFEQFAPLVDPASTGFAPKLNVLRDGTHLSNLGAMMVGAFNASWWEDEFGSGFEQIYASSVYENYMTQIGPEINVLDNPGLTGSGGTATAGSGSVTGTIPANWRVYNSAGAQSVVCSVVDNLTDARDVSLSLGKRLKLEITGASATSDVQIYPSMGNVSPRLTLGKYVYGEVDVEVESSTALRNVALRLEWQYAANPGGGATQRAVAGSSGTGATLVSGEFRRRFRLRTPKIQLEEGSTLNATQVFFLNFYFDGAGAAVAYVSNPRVVQSDS